MIRTILRFAPLALVLATAACSAAPPAPAPSEPQVATVAHPSLDLEAIRARLAAHRAEQIGRLEVYAQAGQFPHNTTTTPELHMFRDADGRLCAVANLVHQDGRDDLVNATVRDQNALAIADVHGGPMLDWVLGSGLTQEELARIQRPAPMLMQKPVLKPTQVAELAPHRTGMTESEMNATIRAHVATVEAELRANADKSLDTAVERYVTPAGA